MALGRNNDEFISDYLDAWANALIKEVRDNLKSKDTWYDRSTLAQSIIALPIENDATGFTVQIEMNDYGTFVDEGRGRSEKGLISPIEKIEDWITRRGIKITIKNKTSRIRKKPPKIIDPILRERRSMAFAIATKHKNVGYKAKGYGFWSEIVNDAKINELAEALANQFGERFDVTVITEE